MRLGVFQNVRFVVDSSREPHHTNIAVIPTELPRKEYSIGIAGDGVESAVFTGSFALTNAFGRAEYARVAVSQAMPGSEYQRTYDILFRKPLLFAVGPYEKSWTAAARFGRVEHKFDSKHSVDVYDESVAYHQKAGGWTSTWRAFHELSRLEPAAEASFANLEQSGWKAKASVAYEWSNDTRDNAMIPMQGMLQRATVEVAVDPHKAQAMFVKLEAAANAALPLPQLDGSLVLRFRGGHIIPLRGRAEPEHANPSVSSLDAFHVGGPHHVPGFQPRGVGRTHAHESLGNTTYWLASAHLLFGLGAMVPSFIKGHVHASACGVSDVIGAAVASPQGVLGALDSSALRASAGLGLVLGLPGMGRLTFTWSHVFREQTNDNTTKYVQVGFTTSFD